MTTEKAQDSAAPTGAASALSAGLGAWLPIETAPKDGTEILVYTRSECFYVVAYDDIFSAPWRIRNDEGLNEVVPTHWMPLPEAPNAEVSGAGTASAGLPGCAPAMTTEKG